MVGRALFSDLSVLTMGHFLCSGHTITVSRRNLERADGDWVDPNLFAEDFSVAAATGFQVDSHVFKHQHP